MLPQLLLAALAAPTLPGLLHRLEGLPPGLERTVRATELLMGTPYEKHPLGEGFGIDKNPRFRLDAFDCQTFVETTLALGQATTPEAVQSTLDDIRYAGAPAFEERNHYMMSQWVPSNTKKGYLMPAPETGKVAEKEITKASWESRSPRNISLPRSRIPLGTFALPLTDLESLEARAKDIPSGTLMLIVREDRPRIPDRITHLGFVIQKGNATFFRHASDVFNRVVDEPLAHFITRNRRYTYVVSGVALIPVRVNQVRVASLPLPVPSPAD